MGDSIEDITGRSFDEWTRLFKENPDEFECQRKNVIEQEIERCPDPTMRARLQAMFWSQETRLGKIQDPVARYNTIVAQLLGEQLPKFHDALRACISCSECQAFLLPRK